jgi:hypothetical protein
MGGVVPTSHSCLDPPPGQTPSSPVPFPAGCWPCTPTDRGTRTHSSSKPSSLVSRASWRLPEAPARRPSSFATTPQIECPQQQRSSTTLISPKALRPRPLDLDLAGRSSICRPCSELDSPVAQAPEGQGRWGDRREIHPR